MCAKLSRKTVLEVVDDGILENTCSPSFSESKISEDSDNSEEKLADPFEFLDGGLTIKTGKKQQSIQRKKKLKIVDENEMSPAAKKARIIESEPIECSPAPISDQTVSFCVSDEPSYDAKEATFLRDFWWERGDDKKRRDAVLCYDMDIFEIYHIMRKRASIAVPRIFLARKEVECQESEQSISCEPSHMKQNCSVIDRQKTILNIFSRRYGLRLSAETLHLGIGLLDKCLDLFIVFPNSIIDLASVNLVIASKVEEVNFLTLKDVVICDLVNEKCIKMLYKLEQMILRTISFEVTFPTPLTFANYLLVTLGAGPSKINMTHYLLELSLLAISTRWHSSDVVAHAATCLAYAIDTNEHSSSTKQLCETEEKLADFARIKPAKSRPVMKIMMKQFLQASRDLHEIYMEYERTGRDSVALRSICRDLEHLIMDSR